ncbi:MAG: zf-HC2 domain-containing protein [Actinomycetota bacterium]
MSDHEASQLDCTSAIERLWRLFDDGRAVNDDARLSAHLAWCLRCCGELEFARHLQRLLADSGRLEPPDDVRERLERVIDALPTDTA